MRLLIPLVLCLFLMGGCAALQAMGQQLSESDQIEQDRLDGKITDEEAAKKQHALNQRAFSSTSGMTWWDRALVAVFGVALVAFRHKVPVLSYLFTLWAPYKKK